MYLDFHILYQVIFECSAALPSFIWEFLWRSIVHPYRFSVSTDSIKPAWGIPRINWFSYMSWLILGQTHITPGSQRQRPLISLSHRTSQHTCLPESRWSEQHLWGHVPWRSGGRCPPLWWPLRHHDTCGCQRYGCHAPLEVHDRGRPVHSPDQCHQRQQVRFVHVSSPCFMLAFYILQYIRICFYIYSFLQRRLDALDVNSFYFAHGN